MAPASEMPLLWKAAIGITSLSLLLVGRSYFAALALPSGNTAQYVAQAVLPAGTEILVGPSAGRCVSILHLFGAGPMVRME